MQTGGREGSVDLPEAPGGGLRSGPQVAFPPRPGGTATDGRAGINT